MLAAVKGYYDGKQIVVNEEDRENLNTGDEVVITIINRIVATKEETRKDKRKKMIDFDQFVIPSGRTVEEIDEYVRELRDNDRF